MHAFRDHEVRPLISTKRHSASGGFSSSSVSALRSKSFQSLAQPHSSSTDGDPSASQSAAHHSTSSTLQRLKQLQQRNSGNLWRRRVHAQGVSLVVESFDAWLSPTKYQGTPAPASSSSSSFSHHRNGSGSWVLRDNDAVLCSGPPRTGKTEFSYLVAATHLARGGQVHFLVVQGLGQPFNIRRFVTVLEGALRREQEGQRAGIQKNNPSSSSSSSSLQDAVTRLVDHHLAVTVCLSLEDLRVTLQNPHKTFPLSPASKTAATPCVIGNNKHGTREGGSASKKRGREAEDAVPFPSNLSLLKGNHPPQAVWTRGDVGTTRRSGSSKSDTENRREGDDEDDETGPPPVVPLVVLDGLGAASYSHQKWKSLGQLHDLSSLLEDDLPRYCQLQECALLMIETTFPVDQRGGGSGSQGGPMDNSPLLLAVQRTLHRQGSHARRSAVAALSWQTQHQHNHHRNNNGHAVSIGSLPSSGAPPLAMVGLLSFHRCGVVPPSQQAVLMKDDENNEEEEEEEATKEGEKNALLLKEYSVRYHVAVSSLSTRPVPPTTAASSLLASSYGHPTKYHHPPQTGVGLQSRDEGALWFAIDHSGVIW